MTTFFLKIKPSQRRLKLESTFRQVIFFNLRFDFWFVQLCVQLIRLRCVAGIVSMSDHHRQQMDNFLSLSLSFSLELLSPFYFSFTTLKPADQKLSRALKSFYCLGLRVKLAREPVNLVSWSSGSILASIYSTQL